MQGRKWQVPGMLHATGELWLSRAGREWHVPSVLDAKGGLLVNRAGSGMR